MINVLKREEYTRSLPNSSWLRNMLEFRKEDLEEIGEEEFKHDLSMLTKILEQCVMIVEGKPIYLTDKQWDWLYDYFLDMHEALDHLYEMWRKHIKGKGHPETLRDWGKSLDEYISLHFEKDIDSCLENIDNDLRHKTFRCIGCNRELEVHHMRVLIWSKHKSDIRHVMWKQRGLCISILKCVMHWHESDKTDIHLLRNAYRILRGTPMGLEVFLDPYTLCALQIALKAHQDSLEEDEAYQSTKKNKDVKQILKMLERDVIPQMEKPLCWSCAGEGICPIYKNDVEDQPNK